MSYCRFSSDNFKSDLYIYESNEGFVIHVASVRYVGEVPVLGQSDEYPELHDWLEAIKRQMEFLETAKKESIPLPSAGSHFTVDSATECAEIVESLRDEGFHVPAGVIEALREEEVGRA